MSRQALFMYPVSDPPTLTERAGTYHLPIKHTIDDRRPVLDVVQVPMCHFQFRDIDNLLLGEHSELDVLAVVAKASKGASECRQASERSRKRESV